MQHLLRKDVAMEKSLNKLRPEERAAVMPSKSPHRHSFLAPLKNAMLLSAIVITPFRLSFVLSTLPEFTIASHPSPKIYTTSVDSTQNTPDDSAHF